MALLRGKSFVDMHLDRSGAVLVEHGVLKWTWVFEKTIHLEVSLRETGALEKNGTVHAVLKIIPTDNATLTAYQESENETTDASAPVMVSSSLTSSYPPNPITKERTPEETIQEEPVTKAPSSDELSLNRPSSTEPSSNEPSSTQPSSTELTSPEPSSTEPSSTEPSSTEPSSTAPSSTKCSKSESSPTISQTFDGDDPKDDKHNSNPTTACTAANLAPFNPAITHVPSLRKTHITRFKSQEKKRLPNCKLRILDGLVLRTTTVYSARAVKRKKDVITANFGFGSLQSLERRAAVARQEILKFYPRQGSLLSSVTNLLEDDAVSDCPEDLATQEADLVSSCPCEKHQDRLPSKQNDESPLMLQLESPRKPASSTVAVSPASPSLSISDVIPSMLSKLFTAPNTVFSFVSSSRLSLNATVPSISQSLVSAPQQDKRKTDQCTNPKETPSVEELPASTKPKYDHYAAILQFSKTRAAAQSKQAKPTPSRYFLKRTCTRHAAFLQTIPAKYSRDFFFCYASYKHTKEPIPHAQRISSERSVSSLRTLCKR
ncbi:hypothetical protein BJ508DRAFT_332662 [Ascobolus immersus RN42]|uniref:Uncharacterized protein n=1 Tax=Ascobolus immersus RN42 TaxID=1160509 RepID=A0A3N4HM19_ASCIM|nr:hypothetical protein BJ508DRAFT_332662 [Ascobolus immersus RN42]